MLTKTKISNEEFEKMAPRLGPCELVDGEIVYMAPASFGHGEVESNIASIVRVYAKRKHLGRVSVGETGMHVWPGTTRGADVTFISYERAPKDATRFLRVAPELVAEVKSDDATWGKLRKKVREYHRFGVELVWIADPATETVRVYPRNGKMSVIPRRGQISGGTVLPGFRVKIAEFFEV